MTRLRAAVATEFLKSRRSRVPWGVAVGFSIAPLVMGLFMVILKDPDAARALGLLGAKAQLTAGTADWPTYWSLLGQAVTVGGAILFAFLTAWVFGREFADRTVRGPARVRDAATHDRHRQGAGHRRLGRRDLRVGAAPQPRDRLADRPPGLVGVVGDPGAGDDRVRRTPDDRSAERDRVLCRRRSRVHRALAWAVATVAASQVLAVLGWGAWFPWAVPAILAGRRRSGRARWSGRHRTGGTCGRRRNRSRRSPGGSAPTKPAEADPASRGQPGSPTRFRPRQRRRMGLPITRSVVGAERFERSTS